MNLGAYPHRYRKHHWRPGSRERLYHKLLMIIDSYNFIGVIHSQGLEPSATIIGLNLRMKNC